MPYDSNYKATVFAGSDTRAPGKSYGPHPDGKIVEDWWTGISRPYGNERTGYDTQKPLALLNLIVKASSNDGDLILDPFCGCGTTLMAAQELQRQWVGIDISPWAVDIMKGRLLRKFPNLDLYIDGVPTDMDSAYLMHNDKPLAFEAWVLQRIPGIAPNEKQVGDRGVDGRGYLVDKNREGDTQSVIVQVKGGKHGMTASEFRDFQHVIERENAFMGIVVVMENSMNRNQRREARIAGDVHLAATAYPKIQFWTLEDHFAGRAPSLPPMLDPFTGKPILPKAIL